MWLQSFSLSNTWSGAFSLAYVQSSHNSMKFVGSTLFRICGIYLSDHGCKLHCRNLKSLVLTGVLTWSLLGPCWGPYWVLTGSLLGPCLVLAWSFLTGPLLGPYLVATWSLLGPYLVLTWSLLGPYWVQSLLLGPYSVSALSHFNIRKQAVTAVIVPSKYRKDDFGSHSPRERGIYLAPWRKAHGKTPGTDLTPKVLNLQHILPETDIQERFQAMIHKKHRWTFDPKNIWNFQVKVKWLFRETIMSAYLVRSRWYKLPGMQMTTWQDKLKHC
jgi:hypothetical protein